MSLLNILNKIKDFSGLEFCKQPKSRLYLGFGMSSLLLGLNFFPNFEYTDLVCYSVLGFGTIQSSNEKCKELIEQDQEDLRYLFEDAEFLKWKMNTSDEEIVQEWLKYL